MSDSSGILVLAFCFAMTLGLTAWVRKILLRRDLLDRPNERSSHSQPVPRGGGWAILPVILPGLLIASLMQHTVPAHIWLLAGTLLLALISWLDDKKGVSARLRLSLHLLATSIGTLSLPANFMLFGGFLPLSLDHALIIIGWAWFINLYNFMDGIDGITGVETISIASGLCWLMLTMGIDDPFVSVMTSMLTGCCLGFLVFNWHPAKIFLGDIGSVPLGYLTGFGLLTIAAHGHPVSALILPLYYLADSGITITRRALRGEKIWQAHRQHFYQRAVQGVGRHDRVVFAILVTNLLLIGCSLLALFYPTAGLALAIAAVALLLGKLHKLGHAQTDRHITP